MNILMISGSRNPKGQTAKAANAIIEGIKHAGGTAISVFLPTLKIERCRQCDDDGWGLCHQEGRCIIEDDFAQLVQSIRSANAVVFATPVYYGDLSESIRAFLDRLRRTCTHDSGRIIANNKRVIGLCVAGGGGGGAPACCVNLEKVLTTCGFDVVDMIPVRRQNLIAKLPQLQVIGKWFTEK